MDKDGILLTEQRDINKYISQMFEDKFSAEELHFNTHKLDEFMNKYNIVLPRIDSETNQELSEPYIEIEIKEAIFRLKINSQGGADRISAGLVKDLMGKVPSLLSSALLKTLNSGNLNLPCFNIKTLLLLKKGKKINDISNLRPINLSCIFYKIMSNVISRRLKRAISNCSLLPKNIMAYQRGKSPVEAVMYLKDIISVAESNNTKYTLLVADLEAAYDRIYKNYIIFLLHKMNFPHSLIKTLELLLDNNKALITINNSQEGVL